MKKWFKYIHLWLSIPSGVIIFIICITGAIMVFQKEIIELSNKERYYVIEVKESVLPLDFIVASVNKELNQDTIKSIQLFSDKQRTIEATLSSAPRSYVYINPYTAEITGYNNVRSGFFHGVLRLHRWMMMSDIDNGRVITGGATLFFVIILISGILIWYPHQRKQFKSSFIIKRKVNFARRVFDLHRVFGMYAMVVLLVMALTGTMWSFEWYRNGVATIFNIENSTKGKDGKAKESKGSNKEAKLKLKESESILWQDVFDAIRHDSINYEYAKIEPSGVVTILPLDAMTPRATDKYRYNKLDKNIILTSRYGEKRDRSYMMSWAYVIHVGSWGGFVTKILAFVASLIGASLPITGYVLYYRKLKRRSKSN